MAAVHTQTADGRYVQLTLTREEARRLGESLVAQADRLDRYRTCEGCGTEYDPEDYLVRKYGGYCHRQRAALAAADGREPEAG
jgi:hypothetical protein